ncbi:MAG: hypothetical protein JHD16_12950, partial [Solirubrobacteraceae bacterium]|nr:hypothetical protein [Solirubrobacteraceae bacterium]
MSEDWYRGEAWGRTDREAFEARLARARPENRPEYLRIKAVYLLGSRKPSNKVAGAELMQRIIRDYGDLPEHASEVAGAHVELARLCVSSGDVVQAAGHYRACLRAEEGRNFSHGAESELAELIVREPELAGCLDEARGLVDDARAAEFFARSQQFAWALTRARLAALDGAPDLAAAFASGALWLFRNDHPITTRHPGIGAIEAIDRATYDELQQLVAAGSAEVASPLVADYRRADGTIEWEWSLVRRLGQTADPQAQPSQAVGNLDDSADDAARPVLAELRAAGFDDAFDLFTWTHQKRASAAEVKAAVPILLRWMREATNFDVRAACAFGLKDPRARKLAADAVVEAFDELSDPAISPAHQPMPESLWDEPSEGPQLSPREYARRRYKSDLGQAMSTLARDPQFDRLARIVRNPDHATHRVYAFWALDYVKDPAVVDLMLDLVDDEHVGL